MDKNEELKTQALNEEINKKDDGLNDKQREAVYIRGVNTLVSAGAGSGKTYVLTKRVISLLTDEKNPVDIDRLFVATFTVSATAEMKERIRKAINDEIKKIRKEKGYTQDYVAEQINVSTDLLRSIENGRNIGSITTLLNICNFLQVSPNTLFAELLDFKEETLDSSLLNLTNQLSKEGKNILKEIIIHIDKNY